MANVAHKNLTGTDLHENKGVSAATADTVATASGAGATVWKKLDKNSLTGTGNPFGGQLLHIKDVKSSGVDGGTFTAGSWIDRDLNTAVTSEIAGASLGSNQITLPAGTYFIDASAPAYKCNLHRTLLYNVTDAAQMISGSSEFSSASANYCATRSFLSGRFTLAGTKTLAFQHQCDFTAAGNGLGVASNMGAEVYSDVKIWKVA